MNQFVQTPDAQMFAARDSRDSRQFGSVAEVAEDAETNELRDEGRVPSDDNFVDRRRGGDSDNPSRERRQFANSHQELSPEAVRLATAIDEYKLRHRRRFITYEEMLGVIKSLGYKLS